ncbi:MAG TPA: NAD(P)-dependent oxidoreductase, partial [Ignavibacteriaceae bacterium]|nr:NAD(P)-dependent oxidoreductase [Ignavibacteriaceae bacterium]
CARGGIINEIELLAALNSGKVSSAAFDVYETEPPDVSNELLNHPKVVCTPHLGASTEEAQIKVAIQIAEQIAELFSGKTPTGIINASAIAAGSNKEISEYVKLGEILGSLSAQMLSGQLKQVNLNYSGEILHTSMNLLSTAVMKGFLSKTLTENVNFINAPYFSKELGIGLNETKSETDTDYKNSLKVEFITEEGKKIIAGTVLGNAEIRIIQVDEFHLEMKPEGNMIFYTNVDKPGVLAAVGKILADADINIAGLSLGRLGIGKKALTVVSVDNTVDKSILLSISQIKGVENSLLAII